MEIHYSSLDTIEKYNTLFNEFSSTKTSYLTLNINRQLIDFSSGLGLSNSIHERFIKSILSEYKNRYSLSNTKKDKIIYKYKSPKKIKEFIELFELNLDESFDLMKNEIQTKYPIINNMDNLLSIIKEQRDIRNDYLHGDFNFSDEISFEKFNEHLLRFQEIHNYVFKIIRYSFNKNIDNLPEL